LRTIAPYLIVLAVSAFLYLLANRIEFVAPGGRIGPDFWPKAILLLAIATCAYQIVKTLFFARRDQKIAGVLESIIEEAPADTAGEEPQARSYLHLLLTGAAMTIAYVVLIERLGFFLCTFLYLAGFTWVGRYRRPGIVLASSLLGSLVFMFVFMKIVYVSLPLGQEPFSEVSFLLMRLMGIR